MRSKIYFVTLIPVIAIAVAWFAFEPVFAPSTSNKATTTAPMGQGPLDGMTFVGALGPDGKPKDIPDKFVFANGNFVSEECEQRCEYPARPYFVRTVDGKTVFISETQCPYKDAKIVWRGVIDGGEIRGKSTWTVKRWYWTVENVFEFEGKLANQSAPVAISQ